MSDLVVLAFNDEYTADKAKMKLLELQEQRLIMLEDLVVVVRHLDGKVDVKQPQKATAGGAMGGAFWGMLIGLIFLSPFLGAAIGAGMGALMGHYHDLGVDEKFTKEVGAYLKPGTSGIFLLIRQVTADRVISQMQEFHPYVIRTSLSAEKEAKLRESFSESPYASSQTSVDEQLQSLQNLQQGGLITQEDYNTKKNQLLGK
jgi:uncharacterized membrane protein